MSYNYDYKTKPIKEDPLPIPEHIQKIIDAFDQAGLIYIRGALDDQEIEFLDLINRRPDTHRKYVTYIMRVKTEKKYVKGNETDEALIYHMNEEVQNHLDQYPPPLDRERGFWWRKQTAQVRNASGRGSAVQVRGDIPVFEIPFSPENVDKIIQISDIGVQQFYIAYGANAPPSIVKGDPATIFNLEDFKNGKFEELMDMSRYNYSTTEPRLADWRLEGATIKKQTQTITSQIAPTRAHRPAPPTSVNSP